MAGGCPLPPTESQIADLQRLLWRLPWRPEPPPRTTRQKLAALDWRPPTYREVGQALGVTAQRAQQLERAALAKCRAYCEARGLVLEDLLRG